MIPFPKFDLTLTQEFEMRKMTKGIEEADPSQLKEICIALVKHNYILKNTVTNLVANWNDGPDRAEH